MTDTTTLCLGGPLDGQHRTIHNDCISFRVTKPLRPGESAGGRVADDSVEYQLVWSRVPPPMFSLETRMQLHQQALGQLRKR